MKNVMMGKTKSQRHDLFLDGREWEQCDPAFLYSSDNKKPPRGTGNEDEEGREEPWIPGMLMNCIRKALIW